MLAFAAGAGLMRLWDVRHSACGPCSVDLEEDTQSVWLVDMHNAATPQDVQEIKGDDSPREITIPSQLSKIELPQVQTIISRSGAEFSPEQGAENEVVDLQNASYTRFAPPAQSATETESKISMIEAPVQAKLITSTEEYREFKRQARGTYPVVDFKKQQVLVLESASNLPDKAFEIVSVDDQGGKRLVMYRVNVFGLDKKVNTHSAVAVDNKKLPLELKQVL